MSKHSAPASKKHTANTNSLAKRKRKTDISAAEELYDRHYAYVKGVGTLTYNHTHVYYCEQNILRIFSLLCLN